MPLLLLGLATLVAWQALQALSGGGGSSSTPQPVMITLTSAATQSIAAAAGTPFTISLPPGGVWASQSIGGITYAGLVPSATGFSAWSGSSSVGTSTRVTGLYAGGGGTAMAIWMDSAGATHQTTLTFTG